LTFAAEPSGRRGIDPPPANAQHPGLFRSFPAQGRENIPFPIPGTGRAVESRPELLPILSVCAKKQTFTHRVKVLLGTAMPTKPMDVSHIHELTTLFQGILPDATPLYKQVDSLFHFNFYYKRDNAR